MTKVEVCKGLCLVLVLGVVSCKSRSEAPIKLGEEMCRAITGKGIQGAVETIRVSEVARLEWDRLFVFRAYSWPELVEKRLGFAWPEGRHSATSVQDRYQLMVFVKGSHVAEWADFDTTCGRFDIGDDDPIARSDDLLDVTTTNFGTRVFRHGGAPRRRVFVRRLPDGGEVEVDPNVIRQFIQTP
jgi:hypothetical protein